MRLKFIKSAVLPKDFPLGNANEVGIIGRSNAGKSSLINLLAQQAISKVSSTPGKTRLLNFFEVNNGSFRIVDMPGYGYAARDEEELAQWQKMIETYLLTRSQLRGLVLVMDSRRKWSEDEEMLKQLADHQELGFCIALTKVDKLNRQETINAMKMVQIAAQTENVFAISSLKKTGHKDLEDFIYKHWAP
jgi:GTP-binding protein